MLDYSLLSPVKLPEFGNVEVGWAMCQNPMCEHFGQFFDAAHDRAGNAASRYRVIRKRSKSRGRVLVRLKCRGCGLSITVHAGPSLRPVARHFLSQSLPFADCANEACTNHGVNAFEHVGRQPGPGNTRYRVNGPHTLICAACTAAGREPTHFSIGEPVELSNTRAVRTAVRWIIGSVREHLPVTAVRGLFGIPVGSYYRRLFRLAARVGDYLAWRNAYLLSPEFRRAHGGTARVYTDVLSVSLHQVGDVARSKLLRIIVSVVGLEKTHFVLAAHPYFLPESKEPGLEELEADHDDDNYLTRRWDCLDTVLGDAPMFDEDEDELAEAVPSEGHAGLFLKSPYAEVAHFLTVEKMLSGFARRYYTMDAARDLFQSALVAMRRQVLDKEVEIALFQYRKADDSRTSGKDAKKDDKKAGKKSGKKASKRARAAKPRYGGRKQADEATLRKAWAAGETRFRAALRMGRLPLDKDLSDASLRAYIWKKAFGGGFYEVGGWAWLSFPLNVRQYPESRTLWLTRRPGDTLDDGIPCLLGATHQPADSAFASIRRRMTSARRPWKGALGLSFLEHAYSPPVVGAELTMYLFHRNYHRRPQGPRDQLVPARVMGLIPRGCKPLAPATAFWEFRLAVRHARQITGWLRNRA